MQLEPRARKVRRVLLALRERQAPRARLDSKDPLVSLGSLAPPVLRVNKDLRVPPEQLVRRAFKAFLESPERPGLKVLRARKVHKVLPEPRGLQDLKVNKDLRV